MEEGKVIYFDNNATTMVAPEVFEAMKPFLTNLYGNPSSIHRFGGQVAAHVEAARESLASLLGAAPTELIFTSCGTESDSAAIFSALLNCPKRNKVVTTKVEHPAVLSLGKELERRGYRVSLIPVDGKGRLDLERAAEMLDDQAVGKIPMKLSDMNIDFLSLSGHKLHAPKGVGALYVKRGVRFRPFIVGGHQESGRRAGTENVASIVGLGKAAELARLHIGDEQTRVRAMRDKLEQTVLATIPAVRVNGDPANRLPNTSNISFEYIEGESILMLLDMFQICASSGSACTTGSLEPSHVLRAMGTPYTAAHGAIRFSLSRYNTMEEVDFVLEKLPPVIARLREISPYWKQPAP